LQDLGFKLHGFKAFGKTSCIYHRYASVDTEKLKGNERSVKVSMS
jgi:hypothetical protein